MVKTELETSVPIKQYFTLVQLPENQFSKTQLGFLFSIVT